MTLLSRLTIHVAQYASQIGRRISNWFKPYWQQARRWWQRGSERHGATWQVANQLAAGLIIATILIPVLGPILAASRYHLSETALSLLGSSDPKLANKLTYDVKTGTYQYNHEALKKLDPASPLKNTTGAANAKGASLYALDVPEKIGQGVTYTDVNSQLSFKLVPEFGARDGKLQQGRLVYPFEDGSKAVYTLKNNGLKEDILVTNPSEDALTYNYNFVLPATLEARIIPDTGAIGIYSADPALFGDITYGSSADQTAVERAREKGPKTNMVFGLPAPVIKVAAGGKLGHASARFELHGNRLTVVASNLKSTRGALTIDPSVTVTSTGDFSANGTNESNIDMGTSGQITRGPLTGGTLGSWSSTTTYPIPIEHAGGFTYNGYFYVLGGLQRSVASYTDVNYAVINSNGTLGSWTATTGLPASGNNFGLAVYNGYVYVLGGTFGGAQVTAPYYAPINTNGTIGTWKTSTDIPLGNTNMGATAYNGYIYIVGGSINASNVNYKADVYYAALNADGTIGTWKSTTSLTYVRILTAAAAYNGYLYIMGGAGTGGFVSDCQYAKINSDGTIGAWMTTNSFTTARYGLVASIYNGYAYIVGGWNGGYPTPSQYAQVNADGSLGTWRTSSSITTGRAYSVGAMYNGYAYIGTGWDGSSDYSDFQYAKLDGAGMAAVGTASSSFGSRKGAASVVSNGFIYVIGGDNGGAPLTSNQIMMAQLNADGSIGSYTSQTNVYTTARTFLSAAVYAGYLYIFGGCTSTLVSCTTLANDKADVWSSPLTNTTGVPGTWTQQTSFTTARYGHQTAVYGGYVYLVGGLSASTFQNDVQYASLAVGGTISSWTTAGSNTITTARAGFGMALEGGYIYVAGGCSAGTLSTCTTTQSDIQYAQLNGTGGGFAVNWASAGTTLPSAAGRYGLALFVINGFMYVQGGYDGTTYYGDTQSIPILPAGSINGTTWTSGASYSSAAWGGGYASAGSVLYNSAGLSSIGNFNTTIYTIVNNGGTGGTGTWVASGNDLSSFYPSGVAYGEAFSSDGYLYFAGGQDAGSTVEYSAVYYAPINNDGSVGTWAATTSMNLARTRFGVTVSGGYVYAATGITTLPSTRTATVEYAPLLASGGVGAWTTSPNASASGRQFTKMTSYNNYLYLAGGTTTGTPINDVQYAPISSDGSVGTWTTLTGTSSFTGARFASGVVAYNGYLYVIGGDTNTSTYNDVQYAPLNTNGSITAGSWKYTSALNFFTRFITATAYNGYIYITSGAFYTQTSGSGNIAQYRVQFAPVRADGTLGNWQHANTRDTLGNVVHYQAGAVIANGALYRITGFDGTSAYSDVTYAPLNVINRIGRFSKLVDLGNMSNMSSITYTATSPPTLPNGLRALTYYKYNANGALTGSGLADSVTAVNGTVCSTSTESARYVRLMIVLSDARTSAVFPDSAGTNTANLTDFTINYQPGHPEANQRLHLGKTLSGGTQSALDTCGPT